jgi:hypothetical protein
MTDTFSGLAALGCMLLIIFTIELILPLRKKSMHKFTATHHDRYELHEIPDGGWLLKVYGKEEKSYHYKSLKHAGLEANVLAGTMLNWEYAQPTLVSTAVAAELDVEYQVWALPNGTCELRLKDKRGVGVGMKFHSAADAMGEAHKEAGRALAWHFNGEESPVSERYSDLHVLATSACNTYRLQVYKINGRLTYSLFPGQSQHEFTGPGHAMHAAEVIHMDNWLNGAGGDVYQPIIWIRTTQEN